MASRTFTGRRSEPTNNPLERIMKEIRRRTRVVGAFPDGQSYLNLAALHRRNNVVGQMLHEYAATLSAAYLKPKPSHDECAKDSGHHPLDQYPWGSIEKLRVITAIMLFELAGPRLEKIGIPETGSKIALVAEPVDAVRCWYR
jgi:hypothetical protein